VNVLVFETIKVPNTFTPNGDGYNDTWQIDLLDLFDESLTEVYNTAGQLVYRDIGHGKPWDGTRNGKPVPAGTYYYVIDLKTNADKLRGYVTIIR
jgi:gliding motility-associated-like protein